MVFTLGERCECPPSSVEHMRWKIISKKCLYSIAISVNCLCLCMPPVASSALLVWRVTQITTDRITSEHIRARDVSHKVHAHAHAHVLHTVVHRSAGNLSIHVRFSSFSVSLSLSLALTTVATLMTKMPPSDRHAASWTLSSMCGVNERGALKLAAHYMQHTFFSPSACIFTHYIYWHSLLLVDRLGANTFDHQPTTQRESVATGADVNHPSHLINKMIIRSHIDIAGKFGHIFDPIRFASVVVCWRGVVIAMAVSDNDTGASNWLTSITPKMQRPKCATEWCALVMERVICAK